MVTRKIGIINDPIFEKHEQWYEVPEIPQRTQVISIALQKLKNIKDIPIRKATIEELSLIHSKKYIQEILNSVTGKIYFSTISNCDETTITEGSQEGILYAAGSVLNAVDTVLKRKIGRVFCNIRPPGHHASCARASGFCYVNNIILGAAYYQTQRPNDKIVIIDWDVHHGDGTQDIILDKQFNNIHYISLHEKSLYPDSDKTLNTNYIHNFPLKSNTNDLLVHDIFVNRINPLLKTINPSIVFISCGFDAHQTEKISTLKWSTDLYGWMTKQIITTVGSNTPIISALEGGYNLDTLGECAFEHCAALQS